MDPRARTWAEVSLDRIVENARTLTRLAGPDGAVAAVVKADAYGHGLVPVALACAEAGIRHFATATLDEALALRAAGVAGELYVLAPLLPEEAAEVARAGIVPFISSPDFFDALAGAAHARESPARCFLAIDTGMGREGLSPDEARSLPAAPFLQIVGLSTHLSSADEDDPAPTEAQLAAFAAFVRGWPPAGGLWLSWANSPGMQRFTMSETPEIRGVLYRPGLLLYGIAPYAGALAGGELAPALAWRARITLLRRLPAGATIGYGRTGRLERPSRIATLAVGYGDGLSRQLSNRGKVLLRGRLCPIVGRVSMDQCQIDVTEVPGATVGEIATLIGGDGEASQSALDLATEAQTTPHEPTTTLSKRVPRLYLSGG